MRARVGKIARLPGGIRDELNRRLHHGALGKHLVAWLNALPEVQQMLAAQFAGRPITEDNLSEWRNGGYQDWLQARERRERIRELTEEYHAVSPEQRTSQLTTHTEERLIIELVEALERLRDIADSDKRWKHTKHLIHEFCRLRNTRTFASQQTLLNLKAANSFRPQTPSVGAFRTLSDQNGGGIPPAKPNENCE